MKKLLVCSDLDGTLLKDNKKISFKTKRLIRKFEKDDIYFVMNTGRILAKTLPYVKSLKLKKSYIIINEGSAILTLDSHQNIVDKKLFTMPYSLIQTLLNDSRQMIESAHATTLDVLYLYKTNIPNYLKDKKCKIKTKKCKTIKDFNEDLLDISLYVKPKYKEKFEALVSLPKYQNLRCYFWGNFDKGTDAYFYEFTNTVTNKGSAMIDLALHLGLTSKDTAAFGDQLNDLEMLRYAKYGFAMKNSIEEVQKVAKRCTKKDNNHSGVALEIKDLLKTLK